MPLRRAVKEWTARGDIPNSKTLSIVSQLCVESQAESGNNFAARRKRNGVKMYYVEAIDFAKYENPVGQLVAVTVGERQTPITEFVHIIANIVASRQDGFVAFDTPELLPRLKPDREGLPPSVRNIPAGEVDFDTPEMSLAEFDAKNGTEITSIIELSDALSSNDTATIAKYSRRYPILAKTSSFLKNIGIVGEKFTIGSNAIKRHHGKDGLHAITPTEWIGISKSLSTGKPLGVTRYYDPQKKRIVPDAYRIWTRAFIGDHPAIVGVSVKSNNRDVFVNSVDTVFALNDAAIRKEALVYPNSIEELQSVLADQSRQRYTETPQHVYIIPQTGVESQAETGRKDIVDFDTPELSPAEAEYAASEDKTPTEQVMREVFGMTNEDIATRAGRPRFGR